MTDVLYVLVDDTRAGRITRKQGVLRLVYDDEYRRRRGSTPLSVSMPVETAEHPHQTVAPWLAGLLPDNEGVVARWARTFQVGNSPFALLGTPVGEDCAGSVRFVTEDGLEAALARAGAVGWLDEAEVAKRLRDLKRDETAWLGTDFTGRFSLAGAQAKTALLYEGGRWGVPSGAAATSHILKPAITGLDDHDLNEHLCLSAARRVGLLAANTQIATFEDQTAIVAERYDRVPAPRGWLRRIHQEDACQALGLPPGRKYQNDGGPTPTAIASLLRRVLPGSKGDAAVLQFLDGLTLNWLICGTDAHAKNYSLLLAGRQVRLAPLYDVASALPYPDMPLQKLRLAMKFGGSYLVTSRSSGMWPRVGKELGLPVDVVIECAQALMDRLPDAFADAARDPSITAIESTMPARLVDAVAARIKESKATLEQGQPSRVTPREGAPDTSTSVARVADLVVGQVISMPEAGLEPAIIEAISDPVGGSRALRLIDLDSGERLEATRLLGLHRRVQVHAVTVEHHAYENAGSQVREVRLGNRILEVAPGESVHYTGLVRTDLAGPDWVHTVQPIDVDRKVRPL